MAIVILSPPPRPPPKQSASRDQVLAGVRDYTTLCSDVFRGFLRGGLTRSEALMLVGVWMELMHDDDSHRSEM